MTAQVDTPARTWRRGRSCGRRLGQVMLYVGGVWFLPIVVVIFVGLGFLQALVGGFGDTGQWISVWENSLQPMRYFPLAMAIIFGAGMLPTYVAHGVTRREFAIGAGVVIVGTSLAVAVVGLIGFGVEDLVYGMLGHTRVFESPHLYATPGDVAWVAVEYALMTVVHMAAGLLIGLSYYRFGGLIGTALLLVTAAPVVAVEAMLSVSYLGRLMTEGFGWERLAAGVAVPASVAVLVATSGVVYVAVRRVPIKP